MFSQCHSMGAVACEPREAGPAQQPEWEPWLGPRETQQTLRSAPLHSSTAEDIWAWGVAPFHTHPMPRSLLCWYAGPRSYLPEVVLDCFVIAVCEPLRVLGVAVFIPVGPKGGH